MSASTIMQLQAQLREANARLFDLRKLLDRRPANNAALFETYSVWNGECYALDWLDAADNALEPAGPSHAAQEQAMCRAHGDALQRIGTALGLLPGANLHVECVAAVETLMARQPVPPAQRLTKADTVALWHAVDAMVYQLRAMSDMNSEDPGKYTSELCAAERERMLAAKRALRKVNAIRKAQP